MHRRCALCSDYQSAKHYLQRGILARGLTCVGTAAQLQTQQEIQTTPQVLARIAFPDQRGK